MFQENERIEFKTKLESMRENGTELYLEGKATTPDEIITVYYVNEDIVYMPDYVLDEYGVLTELRFDKVSNW